MSEMTAELIAPCGINCRLCRGYQRKKKPCLGCRVAVEAKSCHNCIIRNCQERNMGLGGLCGECGSYPCQRLRNLDKRYRTKYHMSELDNLDYIMESGMDAFLTREEERWTCKACGTILCVHNDVCAGCGAPVPDYSGEKGVDLQ